MKSIKSITIENFQSHEKTALAPAPAGQLTTIVGPSDSGKTAIIRALRWLLFNVPQGSDFIRVGVEFARVRVDLDDGTTVIRERGKSYNRYVVISQDRGRQVYEGFGQGVPPEVLEATGVRTVTFGDLELNLNLAEQLEGPFLGKSVSAGVRAKVLGKLAGTEEVDWAAKTLGTDIFRRSQDEKRLSNEISDLDRQIAGYDYLPALCMQIGILESLVAKIKVAQERKVALIGLRDRLAQIRTERQAAEAALERWRHLAEAETNLIVAEIAMGRRSRVDGLRTRLQGVQAGLVEAQNRLRTLSYLPALEAAVGSLGAATARRQALGSIRTRFQAVSSALASEQAKAAALTGVSEAAKALARAEALVARRAQAVKLRQDLLAVRDYGRHAAATRDRYAGADQALEILVQSTEAAGRRKSLAELAGKLARVRSNMTAVEAQAVWWTDQARAAQEEYMDALIAAGKCPVCGSEIHPERLKEVV